MKIPNVLSDQLVASAELVDQSTNWPVESWELLKEAGVLRASIPSQYGGRRLEPAERMCEMEEIASCCLTTAFILSQREAAIRQLLKGPVALQDRYLPALCSGEVFLTVGLSQLTTSRQHSGPSLRATPLPSGGYQLDGEIPWVTGADQANAIVVGATLPDAAQLLIVLPMEIKGVTIDAPLQLSALVGSRTSLIRCDSVVIGGENVLAGPTESVLGKIGGGGLDTSCLAIGLAAAASNLISQEARSRADLRDIVEEFAASISHARQTLHELAQSDADAEATLGLRVASTTLALRSTQAALMVTKGAGFVAPHPAQRWARQALFFLVWSCPRPVSQGVLANLLTH